MSKMTVLDSKRYLNFSKDEQDVVKAGIELYKHYLFTNKGKKEFAEFAVGNFEEKQNLFTESLMKEALKRTGLNMEFSKETAFKKKSIREEAFALVAEVLDVVIPSTVADSMSGFVNVLNANYGDSFLINVPNNDLFVVSELADGIAYGKPQRLYKNQVTLIPTNKNITIEEDFYRVIAGKVNFGDWIVRVALSFETKLYSDIYSALTGTYASLPAQQKKATYTQDGFVTLAQTIEGLNRNAKAVAFGTKLALSKVLPSDASIKFGLGQEYNGQGYLGEFMGVSLVELPQVVQPQTDGTLLLDDNTIIFASHAPL